MGKQNSPRIDEFDAICMTARRSTTRGKIGNYVGQLTTPSFANCTSPGNPRQQVRRYVKTPHPNSIRQQFIANALRQAWQFDRLNLTPRRQEVIDAAARIGFYWNTIRIDDNGVETNGYYKAAQRGGLVPSFIREMTIEVREFTTLPPFTSDINTPRLFFVEEVTRYLERLRRIPYGFSPRD